MPRKVLHVGGVGSLYTLGINAVYHDSSACLVHDGKVVAAAEEERFTRIKHGKRPVPFSTWELPYHAIDYCLAEAGLALGDVDHVAYSYDPFLLLGRHAEHQTITLPLEPSAHPAPSEWEAAWDPLFLSSIVNAPRHLVDGAPHHLCERFQVDRREAPYRWHWVDHHRSHASSALLPSPAEEAAVMILDGRGERATSSYWLGQGSALHLLQQVDMPHSLGLLYEQVTAHLGFLPSSDEYKVMALASYGRPHFVHELRAAIDIGESGTYTIRPLDMEAQFGPARPRGDAIEQWHLDLAHSLQAVLEESVVELARWLQRETGSEALCLAGGVALNCVMNSRIRDDGAFKRVWVQPAAGDAGTSLGAALWIDAQERGDGARQYHMEHVYLGPRFDDADVEMFLRSSKVPYRRLDNVARDTAEILSEDRIVGWFQGRMEFGPRALGARSILASPLHAAMQARLNDVKDREDFRPVAPVVLESEARHWFQPAQESPFMLFVHDVLPDVADRIPAVRHVDGTARIQTINRRQHPLYHDLLFEFQAITGVPILVNTSFNTRGEPVVCTPRDALESFWTSPLDALIIGPFLVDKSCPG